MRLLISVLAAAGGISAAVDFNSQVKPILASQCAACHGAERPAGSVRLTDRASVLSNKLVVPGKPEASLLYRVIELPAGTPKAMPPGKQLASAERELLRDWIVEGATWPEGAV